MMWFNKLEKLI